ncbi:MAG: hypothetical protein ACEPO8_03650 [Rhodothermaceae bacterium]
MKRRCKKIPVEQFRKENGIPKHIKVDLYVDEETSGDILKFLRDKGNSKKFNRILFEVLSNRYNDDLYRKENVSDKAKDVTAMKFLNKSVENARIYCKEFILDDKKVVMITHYQKRKQKIDSKLRAQLEKIGGYEYDFN